MQQGQANESQGQTNESEERHEVTADSDVGSPTRRALLTGGAIVAGAAVATLASTEQAAAANVVLGANNTESTATTFTSSASRAVNAVCSAGGAVALSGNSTGAHGRGILGVANASIDSYGVWGVGHHGAGVRGDSDAGTGVRGVTAGRGYGVSGENTATGSAGSGVRGLHAGSGSGVSGVAQGNGYGLNGGGGYCGTYGSGGSYGGIFYGNNTGAYGAYAAGTTGLYASGSSYGVQAYGSTGVYGSGGTGVYGVGGAIGVRGYTGAGGDTAGVQGEAPYRGVKGYGGNAGVFGSSGYVGLWAEGGTYGYYGLATSTSGQNYGVFGATNSPAGFAGYFQGNVAVAGTLSKSAGSFQIDHPLDPEHKWLRHSFVESPDMKNVYDGNATTDSSGLATVKLPAYFSALNRDFRYQLTVIGKLAQAVVDREISNNQFRIRTDQGNVKVSWQVTGIRKDDYAKAHPIVVEELKKASEAGTRQFVPKGSSTRLMRVGPGEAIVSGPAPSPTPHVEATPLSSRP